MCGIAAIFNYRNGEPIDRAELTTIRDAMALRGPDGFGDWVSADGCVGLGHRRLSIIDLSPTGAQPMKSADGSLVVTFNGEIYNYRELRSELEQQGQRFQSTSDTEVLLHLYQREGREMVRRLRGMFAFAIWDSRRQGLFMARDPFGIKPLYYADDGKTLRVASQVKALLAGGHVDTSPEPAGHVGFFLWGYVPSPFTLCRGIRGLSAGVSLWLDRQGNRQETALSSIKTILAEGEARAAESASTVQERKELLHNALRESIQHHMIADVPVGIFLSAGVDSTAITALASETTSNLRTVTLAFAEYRGTPEDESTLAAEVAASCGARHQTVWVSRRDFRDNFNRVMQAMDQPSCDGINSFFVSYAAALSGIKVALSGLGGDELFGGYPSFLQIPSLVRYLQPFSAPAFQPFNRAYRLVSAPVLKRLTSPKYAGLFEYGGTWGGAYLLRRGLYMPWELPEVLDPDLARQGWDDLQPLARLDKAAGQVNSPHLKVAAMEMTFYMRQQLLRDVDWASMNHSLEVRTPLVDAWLLRALAPAMADRNPPGKRDLALAPERELPAAILNRAKTGFTMPVRKWLVEEDSRFDRHRGLRGWAQLIYSAQSGQGCARGQTLQSGFSFLGKTTKPGPTRKIRGDRILALLPDGFGGRGGIAKFNRDLLTALCSCPGVSRVTVIPRLMFDETGELPPGLDWKTDGLGGKITYMRAVVREALRARKKKTPTRLIICGHINLLPAAFLARRLMGSQSASNTAQGPRGAGAGSQPPIALIIHGIDAWQPSPSRISNTLVGKVQSVVAVSGLTRDRFAQWSGFPPARVGILPNSVDISRFEPGPKPEFLLKRYGLQGRKVLLTLGRLASKERQKGFDEVLEVLPELAREIPGLSYMIVGDGDDRDRLVAKARSLGLAVYDTARKDPAAPFDSSVPVWEPTPSCPAPQVVFAGYVAEAEKADHYRAADLYVMPSRGEGFGIVYLEALACGLPVVGSKVDGSREALRDGLLGTLVDPADRKELKDAIRRQLGQRSQRAPEGLAYFSYAEFERRCHHLVGQWVGDLTIAGPRDDGLQDHRTTELRVS